MSNGEIFNAMIDFFEDDDWDFNWLEGIPVLSMGFSGKSGKWMCYAQAREEQHQFVFYSVCPLNAPEDRRAAVAEFITRANYGMIIGNFEMDYEDGEIRYKTSIDVEGTDLIPSLVKQMVYANVIIMDRYLPGIMAVIYGNANPAEQIERLESAYEKPLKGKDDEDFELADGIFDIDDFYSDDDDDEDLDDDYPDDDDFMPPRFTNGYSPN